MIGRRAPVAALAALLVAACGDGGPPGEWVARGDVRWRELHPGGAGGLERLDAPRRGVGFLYDVSETARYENRVLAEGAGVAVGDVDGDGLADLFFAGFGGPSALYRNEGGWRFEDVTSVAGLALEDALVRGAVLVDVDGDADLDLVATVHGGPNRLFLNDGAGVFSERHDAGFGVALGSTSAALADIDADGDLDLYVTNYKTRQADDLLSPVERSVLSRLRPGPDGRLPVPPRIAEHYHVDFDGRFVRWWELGERDELYLNDGAGRFAPTTLTDHLRVAEGSAALDSLRDWGLTARFSDWDGDGDPDLYVANDFNSADGIWINRGDGTFDAASPLAVRTTSLSSMAVDASDIDRDGDLDLVTTDMLARDPRRRLSQVPSFIPRPEPPGVIETRLQVNRNAVQLNRGDGTFAEVAHAAGLAASDWTWGALFVDVDLDGYEDLLVTTGHLWDQIDGDMDARMRATPPGATDWRRQLGMYPSLRQPNAAFRGRGGGFEDVTDEWGWGGEPDISHGIATGDLDADGDLDVVVTRLGEPPLLFRNASRRPRVLVRLRGPAGNRHGVGARVTLRGHPVGDQIDEIAAGGSYLSSPEPAVAFAAVPEGAMEIVVEWPDGRRSVVPDVRANREYEVEAPAPAAPRGSAGGSAGRRALEGGGAPLFADVSGAIAHRHVETGHDDRERQPLIPVSLDRPGPGVSWIDVDGDGDADLLVGSGRGGSPVLIRNLGDGFDRPRALTPALGYDATTILGHRGRGGPELLIGTSAYEIASSEAAARVPALVRVPAGGAAGAPAPVLGSGEPPSATGPLAQADVDGDGDLDVFVGGRAVPWLVPLPASSRLLRNDDGALVADTAGSSPFEAVGLVSGAAFADLDADGAPDLLLAMDWGPIRLFRNEGGRFRETTAEAGLDSLVGRWNAVAPGDFDGDGTLDFVATGWGDNLDVPPRYSIFLGDFDRNGSFDVLEAVRDTGVWRPLRRLDEVMRGLPTLNRLSFAEYRESTLTDLLGAGVEAAARVDVRELRHTVFLNRGGRFEPRPLPAEAQRAPAHGLAVGDLDGDGAEDLILSQNHYDVRPGVPRYDAGRGLWLRGDGTGGFSAVSADESGIRVYGDGRAVALADYDRDGRLDVAVGVNGAETRLFRNEGGRPGLRIRLRGPAGNPDAIGATLRIEYGDGSFGPARAVTSGSGYWAVSEATQTLGAAGPVAAVLVRWPGGGETRRIVGEGVDVVEVERDP